MPRRINTIYKQWAPIIPDDEYKVLDVIFFRTGISTYVLRMKTLIRETGVCEESIRRMMSSWPFLREENVEGKGIGLVFNYEGCINYFENSEPYKAYKASTSNPSISVSTSKTCTLQDLKGRSTTSNTCTNTCTSSISSISPISPYKEDPTPPTSTFCVPVATSREKVDVERKNLADVFEEYFPKSSTLTIER